MKNDYKVLGINYEGHDTSAAIGIGDKIICACEQERFDLIKHSKNFPIDAINECLKISGLKISDIDEIALTVDYYDMIKRIYLQPAIESKDRLDFLINDIDRIKNYNSFEEIVRKKLNYRGKINSYRHHLCHLASAYYPSGFDKAIVFSNDGIGEYETGMLGVGNNGKIQIKDFGAKYPNSLGLIYSAITYYLGWQHHCDEGIIMGLAPYGDPYETIPSSNKKYIEIFRDIILDRSEFNYEINKKWIAYHLKRDTWISNKFIDLFGKPRLKHQKIENHHKNIAAALQLRLEEIVLKKLKYAKQKYKFDYLCIAGGVGLNCSLNGKIVNEKIFKEIFVQPASGDSGVALGSVYLAMAKNSRNNSLKVSKRYNHYLGSRFNDNDIELEIKKTNLKYSKPKNIYLKTAKLINSGKIIAWFQGAAEFGPRALGNRSILCKPYPSEMRDYINSKVKFREYFRPFAPAVLEEKYKKYFNIDQKSPHMLIACQVKEKYNNKISAVVHVDDSCRVQTVSKKNNSNFYKLISEFYKLTNCPVLLNTSFNVKGQPIVNNPKQALESFKNTNIEVLVIGSFLLEKKK